MIRISHNLMRQITANMMFTLMDIMIRISILEGALHLPAGSLTRSAGGSINGLSRALAKVQELHPEISPAWTSSKDTGSYRLALREAAKVLHSMEKAEDLLQDVIGGFTRSTDVAGGQLGDVGRKLRTEILSGDPDSLKKGISYFVRHVKQRAISGIKSQREDSLTLQDEDGGDVVRDVGSGAGMSIEDIVVDFFQNPDRAPKLFAALQHMFSRAFANAPSKLVVFEEWLRNPQQSDTSIAIKNGTLAVYPEGSGGKRLTTLPFKTEAEMREWKKSHPQAVISATFVSRTIREIKEMTAAFFKSHPELLSEADMAQELSGLGYGQSQLHLASDHKKLARRIIQWVQSNLL